jgi:histidinol-phosphate aminotransferase
MSTNRRTWLKQSGLALAGIALLNDNIYALPGHSAFNGTAVPPGAPIRLSSNENPYGPSPMARKAMAEAVAASNRYPWTNTNLLIDKIAAGYGLRGDNVLMGAGSSEILGLVAQYASLTKGNAVAADPTFRSWWNAAEKCGLQIVKVPLTADKKHNLPAMLSSINAQTRLVYVCNPNNPTGTVLPPAELKSFIEEASKKALVLLDEAYIEYCEEPTLAGMVAGNKNLVVVKTFSKIYGLAGARIGYALAHADTIDQLAGLQPWANAGASAVALAAASASLDDKDFINSTKAKNTAAKQAACKVFKEMNIPFIASHTNFIYYSSKGFPGDVNAALKKNNVEATRIIEEEGRWTRITVGTMEEMNIYTTVLKQIWK